MLLMGKSTISMAMFNSKLLNYQRVTTSQIMTIMDSPHLFCCLKHNKFYQAPPITSHDFHGQIQ